MTESILENALGKEDYKFLKSIRTCKIIENHMGIELFNGDEIYGQREKYNEKYTEIFSRYKEELHSEGLPSEFYGAFYDALNFYRNENCNTFKRSQILNKGDVFLDIGCRSGHLAVKASRAVGENGKVYCVDATVASENAVKHHIKQNNLLNVSFIKALIGDEVKESAVFYAGSDNETHSGIFETTYRDHQTQVITQDYHNSTEQLPMYTLDWIKENYNIKTVDAMSLQLNGAEVLALKGAANILKQDRPIIYSTLFQNDSKEGNIKEDAISWLSKFGYKIQHEVSTEIIFVSN